jgi:hypothetical protein
MTLPEPPNQSKVRVRKYLGYFIVPVPKGRYEVWSSEGRLKVIKPNVTKAKKWIRRRVK